MDLQKIYLKSVACFIVQTETNQIAACLESNGCQLVDTIEDADAIILTTCAVTDHSAAFTYDAILDCIKKRRNEAPLYVVGCYSRIEVQLTNELMEKYENIIPVPESSELEDIFTSNKAWDTVSYNDYFSYPYCTQKVETSKHIKNVKAKLATKAFSLIDSIFKKDLLFYYLFRQDHLYSIYVQMKVWPILIAKGCTHACTYCAVRIGRGKYRSKPISSVVDEIKAGANKGYKRVMLIGDELGPYGFDFKDGTTLATLLETINSEDIPVQLGLWYIDCFKLKEVVPALEKLAEKGRLYLLGIPFQSGSKRILKMMNRRYSLDESMDIVANLRKYPGLMIVTQFMVGFPTETEEDFQDSVAVMERGYFDSVEAFCYSPRPGTPAAKMENDVPESVKQERRQILLDIASRKARRLLLKHMVHELVT